MRVGTRQTRLSGPPIAGPLPRPNPAALHRPLIGKMSSGGHRNLPRYIASPHMAALLERLLCARHAAALLRDEPPHRQPAPRRQHSTARVAQIVPLKLEEIPHRS